jgi:hypothetical protein
MRRRRAAASFEEPSLVPLADMLSNTVGVMVFIFIFTVITASGAAVPTRLPMERSSDLPFVVLLCRGQQVYALDAPAALRRFFAPLGKARPETAAEWVESFKSRRLQADAFDLTGELVEAGSGQAIAILASPREDLGEAAAGLHRPTSRLRTFLTRHPASGHFVYFVVYPDALQSFKVARAAVIAQGYATGWGPQAAGEPLLFGSGSGGGVPIGPD